MVSGYSNYHPPEVSLEGLRVIGKKGVDQSEQLHHPLVLTQVLVTLQEEHEVLSIAPCALNGIFMKAYVVFVPSHRETIVT